VKPVCMASSLVRTSLRVGSLAASIVICW
jgi:hypothetical protein